MGWTCDCPSPLPDAEKVAAALVVVVGVDEGVGLRLRFRSRSGTMVRTVGVGAVVAMDVSESEGVAGDHGVDVLSNGECHCVECDDRFGIGVAVLVLVVVVLVVACVAGDDTLAFAATAVRLLLLRGMRRGATTGLSRTGSTMAVRPLAPRHPGRLSMDEDSGDVPVEAGERMGRTVFSWMRSPNVRCCLWWCFGGVSAAGGSLTNSLACAEPMREPARPGDSEAGSLVALAWLGRRGLAVVPSWFLRRSRRNMGMLLRWRGDVGWSILWDFGARDACFGCCCSSPSDAFSRSRCFF